MNINAFKTSIRKEFWEHKGSLVWVPAGLAVLLTVLVLWVVIAASLKIGDREYVTIESERIEFAEAGKRLAEMPMEMREKVTVGMLNGVRSPFDGLLLLVTFFYFLACMYEERKDRSIYFWRSMPISDWHSTFSKVVTGVVIYPAIVLAAAAVVHLIVMIIGTIAAWNFGVSAWDTLWAPSALPVFWFKSLIGYWAMMLWAAPILMYFLLLGAATKRPLLFAVLTPPAVMLVEKLLFDTHVFGTWLGERFRGIAAILWQDMQAMADGEPVFPNVGYSQGAELLGNGQFWLGLVIAGLLMFGSVYARKRLQEV
ncbi:hypothetical protein [Permianibacter aggregans]|uniref:ABC-2 type transport system permease protein n=1 Tax=Permianibacter aggregans TaxID=1510150 RepID=A0A4R6UTJ9_9GAMM|nr:hypothetical protein [Permianibacter aggregans]QGX38776.1 hypothetical protein E2H98_03515 [Permianibacter aggregans]TDQ50580.1 ABC-2 type transport system permease protein [Permianibacter aggregans]